MDFEPGPLPPRDFTPTRVSLLEKLKDMNDSASWERFFELYSHLIYGVARKAGLNDADAQDVLQDTVITVAKQMPGFKYDPAVGRFKGWLMRVTHSRIMDLKRKRSYERDGERQPREVPLEPTDLEQVPASGEFDLEATWAEEWKLHIFEAASKRVREQVDPLEFQAFQLHAMNGVPAKTVARKLKMKLSSVYFAKYKLHILLRKQVRLLERRML